MFGSDKKNDSNLCVSFFKLFFVLERKSRGDWFWSGVWRLKTLMVYVCKLLWSIKGCKHWFSNYCGIFCDSPGRRIHCIAKGWLTLHTTILRLLWGVSRLELHNPERWCATAGCPGDWLHGGVLWPVRRVLGAVFCVRLFTMLSSEQTLHIVNTLWKICGVEPFCDP